MTTKHLLELFGNNDGKCSIDGTSKIAPRFWKQTFSLMIKVGGIWIPVAFGLLPDKMEESYRVFHHMLRRKVEMEGITITLKSILMDFEINIHLRSRNSGNLDSNLKKIMLRYL